MYKKNKFVINDTSKYKNIIREAKLVDLTVNEKKTKIMETQFFFLNIFTICIYSNTISK